MGEHGGRALAFAFAGIALLVPAWARGDGMAFYGRDLSNIRPLLPNEQAAAIVHRKGKQKMVIALNFGLQDEERALWLFPVPGSPAQTKVEIVDAFPQFWGTDPRTRAANLVGDWLVWARATQVWTLLPDSIPYLMRSAPSRVSVYGEVEKWGIHVETITAKSFDDLSSYLREKKVGIAADRLSTFRPYLSGQYVLVLAWIASRKELLKTFPEYEKTWTLGGRRPALYLEFPTDRAYYPLRPTSGYGEEHLTIKLFVAGYVTPQIPPPLDPFLKVNYYDRDEPPEGTPQGFTEGVSSRPFGYTVVSILSEARNFTEDLWFSPASPAGIQFAHAVLLLKPVGPLVVVALIAVLSYLAAGLAALLLLRRWRGYALLGFWNLLTIVGLRIAVGRLAGPRGENLRKTRFFLTFTITYVFLSALVQSTLLASLGSPESRGNPSILLLAFGLFCLVVSLAYWTVRFLYRLVSRRG